MSVKGVETIYETTGPFDIAAIISGADIAEVNKSVEEIRRISGVLNYEHDDSPADAAVIFRRISLNNVEPRHAEV
jgi:hypothetical protein